MKKIITMLAGAMLLVCASVSVADTLPIKLCDEKNKHFQDCKSKAQLCKTLYHHALGTDYILNDNYKTPFESYDRDIDQVLAEYPNAVPQYAKEYDNLIYKGDAIYVDCCNDAKYERVLTKYRVGYEKIANNQEYKDLFKPGSMHAKFKACLLDPNSNLAECNGFDPDYLKQFGAEARCKFFDGRGGVID